MNTSFSPVRVDRIASVRSRCGRTIARVPASLLRPVLATASVRKSLDRSDESSTMTTRNGGAADACAAGVCAAAADIARHISPLAMIASRLRLVAASCHPADLTFPAPPESLCAHLTPNPPPVNRAETGQPAPDSGLLRLGNARRTTPWRARPSRCELEHDAAGPAGLLLVVCHPRCSHR